MEEPTSVKVQDEDRLAQLGYKQELKRDWSMMHNFGVSFSIIVSSEISPRPSSPNSSAVNGTLRVSQAFSVALAPAMIQCRSFEGHKAGLTYEQGMFCEQ